MTTYRGSRKHVLDWVAQTDFVDSLNDMLASTGTIVDKSRDRWMPTATDVHEARLSSSGRTLLPKPEQADELAAWWLTHQRGANTPNWDLAASCSLGKDRGLVLIEAKAHEAEMDWGPKKEADPKNQRSVANHDRIRDAIDEARKALADQVPDIAIGRDTHYQLSNRIAFAWKLATMGIPVVLIYLGFTGDAYFKADYLRDADHWQRIMGGYFQGVIPQWLPGKPVDCGKASFVVLVQARPIVSVSR